MPQTHRELPPIVATIYGLTDPRDGGLRYVGRTALTVAERLHQHWLVKDRPPTQAYPVSVWLRALAAACEASRSARSLSLAAGGVCAIVHAPVTQRRCPRGAAHQ